MKKVFPLAVACCLIVSVCFAIPVYCLMHKTSEHAKARRTASITILHDCDGTPVQITKIVITDANGAQPAILNPTFPVYANAAPGTVKFTVTYNAHSISQTEFTVNDGTTNIYDQCYLVKTVNAITNLPDGGFYRVNFNDGSTYCE